MSLQGALAKREKELGTAQEAMAKERAKLDALQEQLKTRRTEVTAQVCGAGVPVQACACK